MVSSINATSQKVKSIFEDAQKVKIIIPEFQRPYEWKREHVEALFNDLWDHMKGNLDNDTAEYFLGPIVTFESKREVNGKTIIENHIIDGQQRLTTLALLLRALYQQIATGNSDDELEDEEKELKQTLWIKNKETKQYEISINPIESRVIVIDEAAIFNKIMETGNAASLNGPYAANYKLLQSMIKSKLSDSNGSLYFSRFIDHVLKNTILLPIIADSLDTAMDIFNTLNDRGLQLNDADIFKSILYSGLPEGNRKEFIDEWNGINSDCERIGIHIQDLFKYYSYYNRAKAEDRSSSTIAIRKYFTMNDNLLLKKKGLMEEIRKLSILYISTYTHEESDDYAWTHDKSIRKSLDILSSFANDWWNYPLSTYYLAHQGDEEFIQNFDTFLHKLIVSLLKTQIAHNNVSSLKTPIMNLDVKIIKSIKPDFNSFESIGNDQIIDGIKKPHPKLERMILKMIAYNHKDQHDLLPKGWDVEHILSQKWDPLLFPSIPTSTVNDLIQHIGNKIPLESVTNKRASNGFFTWKKEYYSSESKIAVALSICENETWNIDSIKWRDKDTVNEMCKLIDQWENC